MTCLEITRQLEIFLDGRLGQRQQPEFQAHIAACDMCRMRLEKVQLLRQGLKRLPTPQPSVGFAERMLATLMSAEQGASRSHRGHWIIGTLGGAIAASILTWAVMLPSSFDIVAESPEVMASVQSVSLKVNEVQPIRLVFNAPADMESVMVSLSLPNHMEIQGYPGEKKIEWMTHFKAGQNVLTLPVIAHGVQQGALVARISDHKSSKEFRVVAQVQDVPELI